MVLFISGVAGEGHSGWKAYSGGSARKTVCVEKRKPPYSCEFNGWSHTAPGQLRAPAWALCSVLPLSMGHWPSCPVLFPIIHLSGHGLYLFCFWLSPKEGTSWEVLTWHFPLHLLPNIAVFLPLEVTHQAKGWAQVPKPRLVTADPQRVCPWTKLQLHYLGTKSSNFTV